MPASASAIARVAEMVKITAKPMADPICWLVLTRPLARPASASLTPENGEFRARNEGATEAGADEQARPQQMDEEARIGRREGKPDKACGKGQQGGDQGVARTEACDGGRSHAGHQHQRHGQRQLAEAGLHRVIGQYVLHIEREGKEEARDGAADQHHGHIAGVDGAVGQDAEIDQGCLRLDLDDDESNQQSDACSKQAKGQRSKKADFQHH